MSLLSGELTFPQRIDVLPGLLRRNAEECKKIKDYLFAGPLDAWRAREVEIFHKMVGLDIEDEHAEQWSKDGWYCLACVKELYRQRFMEWWKQAKAKGGSRLTPPPHPRLTEYAPAGAPVQDDCWYV